METQRVHSGVDVIDTAIPDGIPRNAMVVVFGEAGTGKSVFLASLALNLLKAGEPVIFVTLDDDPASFQQLCESFGWKLDEFVMKNLFKVVDYFSYRVKTAVPQPNYVYRVVNPRESYELVEVLSAAMNDLGMDGHGAIFIDSLNELFAQAEITTALETVKMIRAIAPKAKNVMAYASLHTGIDSVQEILFTLSYSVDGLIECRYDPSLAQLSMPFKQMLVRKLRGSRHQATPMFYSITHEGIRGVDPRKISELLKGLQPSASN